MFSLAFPALGTNAHVLVDGPRPGAAVTAVRAELARIDRLASRFRGDSELSRLNRAAGTPVRVGPELMELLVVALSAARLSDGAVDPTVGASLAACGYDRDFAQVLRAGDRGAWTCVPAAGWERVLADPGAGTVTLPAGASLDLGATAKALAADRAAAAAAAAGGGGVLVNLGGDLAVAGPAPAQGWQVLVSDRHDAGTADEGQVIALRTGGLATSGTALRRWRREGRTLHHLIEPGTGRPARTRWRTVSVAAASCLAANVAATAAMLKDGEAVAWLERRGLPARLVTETGVRVLVAGWPAGPPGPGSRPIERSAA